MRINKSMRINKKMKINKNMRINIRDKSIIRLIYRQLSINKKTTLQIPPQLKKESLGKKEL